MGSATSAVLLAVGSRAADSTLRNLLEPHGYTIDERPPNELPDTMAGYAALILALIQAAFGFFI